MLNVYSDIARTGGAEIVQWHNVTCGTGEIRFYTMIEVFVGSTDIFSEYGRIWDQYLLRSNKKMTNKKVD
jgi:hypothetical protein